MADGFAVHVEFNHGFFGFSGGLLNGAGDIAAFGDTDADFVLVVPHCDQSLEAHAAAALDGAGDAVNVDGDGVKLFGDVVEVAAAIAAAIATARKCLAADVLADASRGDFVGHFESAGLVDDFCLFFGHLELQSFLAGGVCECREAAGI